MNNSFSMLPLAFFLIGILFLLNGNGDEDDAKSKVYDTYTIEQKDSLIHRNIEIIDSLYNIRRDTIQNK